jgi:hypothetical protein
MSLVPTSVHVALLALDGMSPFFLCLPVHDCCLDLGLVGVNILSPYSYP